MTPVSLILLLILGGVEPLVQPDEPEPGADASAARRELPPSSLVPAPELLCVVASPDPYHLALRTRLLWPLGSYGTPYLKSSPTWAGRGVHIHACASYEALPGAHVVLAWGFETLFRPSANPGRHVELDDVRVGIAYRHEHALPKRPDGSGILVFRHRFVFTLPASRASRTADLWGAPALASDIRYNVVGRLHVGVNGSARYLGFLYAEEPGVFPAMHTQWLFGVAPLVEHFVELRDGYGTLSFAAELDWTAARSYDRPEPELSFFADYEDPWKHSVGYGLRVGYTPVRYVTVTLAARNADGYADYGEAASMAIGAPAQLRVPTTLGMTSLFLSVTGRL